MSEKKPKAPQEPINTTTKRWHTLIDSPVGRLYLAASTKALTGLWYKEQTHFPIPDELGEFIPDPRQSLQTASQRLQRAYLSTPLANYKSISPANVQPSQSL